MSANNALLNEISSVDEIRRFTEALKKNISSSLVLTGPAARGYFIAAISLTNKLVVVSDDAFGLYHESLGAKPLSFDYIPAEDSSDVVPKMFNYAFDRIRPYPILIQDKNPNVIYTEHNLDSHVAAPEPSGDDKLNSLSVNENIKIKDIINALNARGYIESQEAKFFGEYARRGGIIDVFPPNTNNPARIELYGDCIKSIRFYNPTSQLSIGQADRVYIPKLNPAITKAKTIPYSDFLLNMGYIVLYVKTKIDFCEISNFDKKKNNVETYTLKTSYLNIKENLDKNRSFITTLFIVGGDNKENINIHKNTIYTDGYVSKNFIINNTGIGIISGVKRLSAHNNTKTTESADYFNYSWGDYISHLDYGIGIYRGLVTKKNKDYVKLEYANNGILYVSAQRVDLIAPLVGVLKPKINDIASKAWATNKNNTKKNIRAIIDEMVLVNKNRSSRREIPYKKEDYLEGELADSFPYVETNDQAGAINDIYNDMATPGLMDRLIIGDVGFGKTEVALRAAAKAAFSGVFVMMVVPTTILADQHYIFFQNRLKRFGITVEMISRFVKTKKQKEIIDLIDDKRVDILVGTHKLLSDNFNKKNLGLLIIDDEHRFGVIHKNKLLKIKNSVDVLTLTATPIPRTLQQSLLGLKAVSLINTPPVNRVPIKTRVIYQNWGFIKSVIEKEINRGGQVYFLNNRIESIPFYKKKIQELLPHVKIATAHGSMKSQELEKTILTFFDGKIQILISTTIIEAGLDVPNANTIIISSSHLFGLSQLYQVRGRVGRGDRQGFCYLVVPKGVALSDEAIERLKTIQENTDLGSGYRIAVKDLEIRGAGNVFGYEQSGHISKIGYNLYCKMFNEELNNARGKTGSPSVPKITYFGDASLKDGYIPLSQDRLFYYQRLSNAKDKKDLSNVKKEIKDRFGRPGSGAKNLYKITALRLAYTNTMINKISVEKDRAILYFAGVDKNTTNELDIEKLMKALEGARIKYVFKQKNKDFFGLELVCGTSEEPLKMLTQYAEIFYYNNNNT